MYVIVEILILPFYFTLTPMISGWLSYCLLKAFFVNCLENLRPSFSPPLFFLVFRFVFFFFLGGAGYMGLRAVSGCQTRCGWCHLSNFLAFHVHSLLPFPIFHLCFSPLLSNFLFLGCLEVLRIIVWLAKWHKQQGKETLILAGDSTMYFC